MNYLKQIRIFSVIITLLFFSAFSAAQDYLLSYYSVEDGLSHNEVTSIAQDDYGFIWFGTRGGLNRYDGYQFKHFKPSREETNTIQDASIECLFNDSDGRLWIGTTSGGYSYYDSMNDRFMVPAGSDKFRMNPVISFDEDTKGNIYTSSFGQGIIKYRSDSIIVDEIVPDGLCRTVKYVNDTLIFFGTQSGLSYFGSDNVVKAVKLKSGYHDPKKIIVDRNHPYLWIVGYHMNLIRFNYLTGNIKTYPFPDSRGNIRSAISLMQDSDGDLWIGTFGHGMLKFNVENSVFNKIHIKPDYITQTNLDYDVVLDIIQDRAGDIWIGTDGGGVVRLSKKNKFSIYDKDGVTDGQHITAVLEDRNGILWIGTKGQGLYAANKSGHFKKIVGSELEGYDDFQTGYVRTIYQSDDGLIWIGLQSTLFVVQNNKDGSRELVVASKYFKSPQMHVRKPLDIVKIGDDLWVATEENGLYVFKKDNDKYVLKEQINVSGEEGQFANTWGLVLHYDDQKRLWVGTKEGLYLYQSDDNSFTSVKSLISNHHIPFDNTILCLHTDNRGQVWFGTSSSLNQLIEEPNGSFTLMEYTKKDGLPDDYINTILSDKQGNIWISTNAGLSMYNKQNRAFVNYDVSDGLGGLNFSEGSGCVGRHGQLYFGGINSLTYFNPTEIIENSYTPPIALTDFKILNKPYAVNPKGVLKKSINSQQRINLNHRQSEFSFEFAVLDYKAPQLNQYAYWLEGRDSERILLGDRRYISFSNLKPGDYTLHLYGTNSNGAWSDQERKINLSISPAPWKTWYANVIYIILVVGIVFLIIKVVRKQEQLNQEVVMEKALRENQKQLNEDKLRFFTNVSHEIRTPLTLILAPLNELLNKDFAKLGHEFVRNKVVSVYNNATSLLELINQLLEFRKVGAEKVKLQVSENNLNDFLFELCKPFEEYALSKDIKFKTKLTQKELPLHFDSAKMSVVVNNLLSNAFKFAGQSGKVSLEVKQNKEHVLISVSNSGKGIVISDIHMLFDRFSQVPGQYSINSTGIGLSLVKSYVDLHKGEIDVESIPDEITTFTVKLLKGKSHFQTEEITQTPTQAQLFKSNVEEEESKPLSKPKKALQGATVLIVEDNKQIRSYLKELLGEDFNVLVAKDGRDGFDKVIENKPELVISDVMMPRMDGFELCQKIRSNALVSHTPVILLTAKGEQKDEVLGTRKGADAYLTKPFNTTLLMEKVNMLLESRRKLAEKYAEKVILAPKDEEVEKEDAKLLKAAIAILEKNMDNVEFKQEELAEQLAMSAMTLNRRFKKLLDITPGTFIRSMRLKRAAQLLTDSDLTITEIMDAVAYLDAKSFRQSFSKEFNMTPSEYRKNSKGIG